ncbi:hypothetical protein VT03_03615 [Planctomyces sp. SH-PL14]|nr:hypothetical protein VT03_03615 [Planctomyces sp. SH-PL14]
MGGVSEACRASLLSALRGALGWGMKDLVLLGDEIAILKLAAKQRVSLREGRTIAHETACEFLCDAGLARCHDEEIELTALGKGLAAWLVKQGISGPRAVSGAILEGLVASDERPKASGS